jgi:ribonuclease P protein component
VRATRLLDVRLMDSSSGHVRIAIVVPKHGHTAVRRNKLKRQLRELTRTEVMPRPVSRDVLFRARHETYAAEFPALKDAVTRVAAAIGTAEAS